MLRAIHVSKKNQCVSSHPSRDTTDSSAAAATSRLAEAFVAASYPRFVDEGLRLRVFSIVTLVTPAFVPRKNVGVGKFDCSYD